MRAKNKLKRVNIKIFMIPFIITTLIFIGVGYVITMGITNYYYEHMKYESLNYAKSYSHSLAKVTEAYDVINELLEEKLLVVSRTTALHSGPHSSELLENLAKTFEVDEIYSYNPQGEVVSSNTGKFIGWKANEGHPVYDFMNSDRTSFVEDIRLELETGVYYKYGYFKTSNGSFVQIGVMADKIQSFNGNFEMQQFLDEMKESGVISHACFINNDFNIVASNDKSFLGKRVIDEKAKAAILEDREYGSIKYINGEKQYEVFVPVYLNGDKIGTLAVGKNLTDTEGFIKKVVYLGSATLIIIYISLLYTLMSTYKKDKKHIQLAYYDTLTGFPNKHYLKEFITEEIHKNRDRKKAMLLINCRDFKFVNMTFGFEYGDEILKELGLKIHALEDENKRLFRYSADRFVLYVKNYENQKELVSIINSITDIFNNPFKVKDGEQYLGVEIGVVEIDSKYDSFNRVLKDALISLSHIKNNYSINYMFFNEIMERRLQREDLIEKELRAAIAQNDSKRLYLQFQPQIDLKTDRIACFEALARMKSESLGFISPLEFIDVAEKKQLIIPLGNMFLRSACDFIKEIKSRGYRDVKVAVNVSGIQLMHKDFVDTVVNIIKEAGIEESNLELEITESVLLDNYDIVNKKLKNLRDHNIAIALDDFGTGYSSFSRLRELNIDTVKIDKYFINKIPIKDEQEIITGDIISMSHKLGLGVVAEGVELEEQKGFLIENNCDIMQGYLFSKPLSQENAIELLKTTNL